MDAKPSATKVSENVKDYNIRREERMQRAREPNKEYDLFDIIP